MTVAIRSLRLLNIRNLWILLKKIKIFQLVFKLWWMWLNIPPMHHPGRTTYQKMVGTFLF